MEDIMIAIVPSTLICSVGISRFPPELQDRHGIADMVVVADARMLSAANLNALEDAGYSFIVGSRIAKAPSDLTAHFERHGNNFKDGQTLESTRTTGTGAKARDRRVVYHYSFKHEKRDNYTLNKQIEKAEKVTDGARPLKKDRLNIRHLENHR